jgi:hypothetical protein
MTLFQVEEVALIVYAAHWIHDLNMSAAKSSTSRFFDMS